MIENIKDILKKILLELFPALYKRLFYKNLNHLDVERIIKKRKEREMLVLNKIVPKDKPVFDIGANYGDYTYLLEKIVPANKIYAFEPIPDLYKRLKKVFPKSNIFDFALSNYEGIATFKIPYVNNKMLKSRGTLQLQIKEKNETSKTIIDVNTITLDKFLENHKLDAIGFIKIDVEGNELNVIKGGVNTIKKYKPTLMIEIEQRHHQEKITHILDMITDLNYSCYFVNKDLNLTKLNVDPVSLQNNNELYVNNFIFIPKE